MNFQLAKGSSPFSVGNEQKTKAQSSWGSLHPFAPHLGRYIEFNFLPKSTETKTFLPRRCGVRLSRALRIRSVTKT